MIQGGSKNWYRWFWVSGFVLMCNVLGCAPVFESSRPLSDADLQQYLTKIDYPVERRFETAVPIFDGQDPLQVPEGAEAEYWDIPLEEVLDMALTHSKVMRELGATVLRSPESIATTYDPAITENDPRFGVESALSEFDAKLIGGFRGAKNDRRLNNRVFGLVGVVDQDLFTADLAISKTSVTGSSFVLRSSTTYDRNNVPTNAFPKSWDQILEAEIRQPLLQGAGVGFNRLAGPNSNPGTPNGVLIARTKTDISLAEFEISLRDFLSNVENAYWDLYFAYRDLDAKSTSRDAALETWNYVKTRIGAPGFDAAKEAQVREQYFRFQQQVFNSLKGRPQDGTRTNNGSRPGTFRGTLGVRVAERKLRLLIGLPISEYRILRPADEPIMAKTVYDWEEISSEAISSRPELRRQRWKLRQREMELKANKNFLLPRVDLLARYRWRGFGEDLIGGDNGGPFDDAVGNFFDGDFQEWEAGVEITVPLGYRKQAVAVRNAQFKLARERALLREQERQVLHDLSNALAETERAFDNYQLGHDRLIAAKAQLEALQVKREADRVELDVVLEAQRRLADALSDYYRVQVEYSVSVRNVQFEKGSLLEYCGVYLTEGPWHEKAYHDAAEREWRRGYPAKPFDIANRPVAAHSH